MRLTPNPEAALAARRCLDRLGTVLPSEKLEDVRLMVSELVTNSVRHAGLSPDEQISLTVAISDGSVRGRVCDPGPGFEKPSEPRPRTDLSGGWGATAARAFGSSSTKVPPSLILVSLFHPCMVCT